MTSCGCNASLIKAEAAAAVLWASCFCQTVLWSYGLIPLEAAKLLAQAEASSEVECFLLHTASWASSHRFVLKVPEFLKLLVWLLELLLWSRPAKLQPLKLAVQEAALQNERCRPRLCASSSKLSSRTRLRKLLTSLEASKLALPHPCQAPSW